MIMVLIMVVFCHCHYRHYSQWNTFPGLLLGWIGQLEKDRASAAIYEGMQESHSYSGLLRHAFNVLGERVLWKKIVSFVGPGKYTGMSIFWKCNFILAFRFASQYHVNFCIL